MPRREIFKHNLRSHMCSAITETTTTAWAAQTSAKTSVTTW